MLVALSTHDLGNIYMLALNWFMLLNVCEQACVILVLVADLIR